MNLFLTKNRFSISSFVSYLSFFCALSICCLPLKAQSFGSSAPPQFQVNNWRSLTSMVNARAVVADSSNRLWAVTAGGVVSVDMNTNNYTEYRNTEGLLSLDGISIAFHAATNSVYIGTFDGYIEIYSLDSLTWKHITDIQVAAEQYPRRSINQIVFRGDTAFFATDFGFSVFDVKRKVFIETVDRIGTLDQKLAVRKLLLDRDSIFIACENGVFTAPLNTTTLRVPEVWRKVQANGPDSLRNCLDLCSDSRGAVYALSPGYLYTLKNDTFEVSLTAPGNAPLISMVAIDTVLYYSRRDFVGRLDGKDPIIQHPSPINSISRVRINGTERLTLHYSRSGFGILSSDSLRLFAPNTMYTNRVQRICADVRSRVWIATSNKATDGQGISVYDGERWQNFNTTLQRTFPSDNVWRISATKDSTVWGGTWGNGLLALKMNDSLVQTTLLNETNTPLTGIAGGPSYVLSGDAISDISGNSWIINYDPVGGAGPLFVKRDKQGNWTSNANQSGSGRDYFMIAIDASNTKWAAGPSGLVWFNENATGSKWGSITASNSTLPDNDVTAFTADKNGSLWIGTGSGVSVISFPSTVLRGTGTAPTITKLRLLRDQVINDIMVDAQNNKWIATNTGVWVLTDDGADTIGYLNRKRYPAMLSDEVRCLATNENDGTVYIGSLFGLNTVRTLALRPAPSFDLNIFPQPFSPARDVQLVIEGLEADVVLHIVSIDGVLVREIETTSRRAVWDGRDKNGNYVNSGVYLVLAVSQANTTTAVAKFIVKP